MPASADPVQEAALRALPQKLQLNAIVAVSPESFTGISGVKIETMSMIRSRQAFAILPSGGEPELLVCGIERTWTAMQSWIPTINTYVEFVQHPIDVLAERLTALGLGEGEIGIDADFLPLGSYQHLMERLPRLRLVDTSGHIGAIRSIKTPAQIRVLEHGARGTHRAALEAMQNSQLGDSEITMVQRIADGMIRYGAERALFLYLLSGDRTTTAHGRPSERTVNESEIIRFDVGGFTSCSPATSRALIPPATRRRCNAAPTPPCARYRGWRSTRSGPAWWRSISSSCAAMRSPSTASPFAWDWSGTAWGWRSMKGRCCGRGKNPASRPAWCSISR